LLAIFPILGADSGEFTVEMHHGGFLLEKELIGPMLVGKFNDLIIVRQALGL